MLLTVQRTFTQLHFISFIVINVILLVDT